MESLDIFRPCAVVSDELFPTDISRRGDSRLAHPFKGGIVSPIPKVPKGRLSHSRAILGPEQTVRIGTDVGHWGIRPSLRDLCESSFEPSSELPGYSRISLRETKAANRSKLPSSRRDGKIVFIRWGTIPLKTARNQCVATEGCSGSFAAWFELLTGNAICAGTRNRGTNSALLFFHAAWAICCQ